MSKDFGYAIVGYSVLLFVVMVIILLSPIVTIWSLNTLFHTTIEYTMWTYLASLWLTGIVAGGAVTRK